MRTGFTFIVTGVLLELIGSSVDQISLPIQLDHMIFYLAGMVCVAMGVFLSISSGTIRPQWGNILLLTILIIAGIVGFASFQAPQPAPQSHQHDLADQGAVIHSYGDEINISLEKLTEINAMLSQARAATEKYKDVQLAIVDGYKQEGPSRNWEGGHFINRKILASGVFDVEHPTFLLYEHHLDWSYELVGVGWLLPKNNETPPAYFAPLAAWHYHEYAPPGICIWENGTINPLNEAECTSQNGTHWNESPWMLHAWLFRSNPAGVFSLLNSQVLGFETGDLSIP